MSAPFRGMIWESDSTANDARFTKPVVYLLIAAAVVILGFNWPIMATTIRSISPIWMAALRVTIAAVAVFAMGLIRGNLVKMPRRDIPMMVSVSIFRLSAVMVLVFFALKYVPAGRASVLVWTTSLWTVPAAAIFLGEKMTRHKWIGVIVGVTGVVILSEVWSNDWREPTVILGTGLLLLAAITSATTAVHIRKHDWAISPLQALPWQLAGAAVFLGTLGLIVDGVPSIDWTPQLVWMILYQAILGSGIAFWAQITVLQHLPAVTGNLTLTGVPVVGVISSSIMLDEPITTGLSIGMVFVVAGVVINLLGDRSATTNR